MYSILNKKANITTKLKTVGYLTWI